MTENPACVRVLMAEDNEDDVLLFRDAFEREGAVRFVHIAKDGTDALAFLHQREGYQGAERPEVVLLDINMPKKDGFQVLHEIKSDENLRATPVIMLTTSRRHEDMLRSYAGGACSFIPKPSTLESIEALADRFCAYWTQVAALPTRP